MNTNSGILIGLALAAGLIEAQASGPLRRTRTLPLSDTETVEVQKVGNAEYSWYETADGRRWTRDARTQRLVRWSGAPHNVPCHAYSASGDHGMGTPGTSGRGVVSSVGEPRIPVIMVAYADLDFQEGTDSAKVSRFLNEQGYADEPLAAGSVADYFTACSYGKFSPRFDVVAKVTLQNGYKHYGAHQGALNDAHAADLVREAVELSCAQGVDFAPYAVDGTAPIVSIIHAGPGEHEDYGDDCDDYVWAHFRPMKILADGVSFASYIINNETLRYFKDGAVENEPMTGIGTFCHEYSHTLGLPDMYDTDYERSGGYSSSLWIFTSLMDGGNANNNSNTPPYFNAIDREILGMTEPETITANGIYTLSPIGNGGKVYRLDTDHPDEYYLLECRMNSGWDKYIGGSGLLIYHIDKSRDRTIFSETYRSISPRLRWDYYNEVNCNPSHPCADLIEAGSLKDSFEDIYQYHDYLRTISTSSLFFPKVGKTSISAVTDPALTWWSGTSCPYTIYDIKRSGEDIVFRVSGFEGGSLPTVQNLEKYVFQSSVHICFSTDLPELVSKATVTCSAANGTEAEEYQIHMRDSNYFYLTIENLLPSTSYNLSITLDSEYGATPADVSTFMTSSYQEGTYPYINLKASQRNEDGTFVPNQSFPLNVANAIGATVRWSFDGKDLPLDKKGLFLLQKDGTLKAVVESPDGGKRIIVKQIKLGSRNE